MAEMRNYTSLRAQILTDYSFTWDAAYTKLLFRDDLDASTRVTTQTDITMGVTANYAASNYASTTVDFIFPFKFKYRQMLDGIARGSVKAHLAVNGSGGGTAGRIWYKFTASLITKTVGGTVTTLAAAATSNEIIYSCTSAESLSMDVAIPFFISLDKKQITENDKLFLRIVFEGSKFDQTTGEGGSVKYDTTLNTDDIFVELPLVMG